MEFRNRTTGDVNTASELKALHPNTAFPRVWDNSVLDMLNVDAILAAPKPIPSTNVKTIRRNGVVQDGLGNWVQAWLEVDMFADTVDGDGVVTTQATHEASHVAKLLQDSNDAANAIIAAELLALDVASIRDLREWVVAQPTAPQALKGREAAAVAKRAGIQ